MPYYIFRCDICNKPQEINCHWQQRERLTPACCNQPMRRDYHAEQFGGVEHKNKGVYPLRDEMSDRTFDSYQDHKAWLKSQGMTWSERNREIDYRRKHVRDRTPASERR